MVDLSFLHQLDWFVGKNIVSLYKDNDLAILDKVSQPESERLRRKTIKLFYEYSLKMPKQPHPDQFSRYHAHPEIEKLLALPKTE